MAVSLRKESAMYAFRECLFSVLSPLGLIQEFSINFGHQFVIDLNRDPIGLDCDPIGRSSQCCCFARSLEGDKGLLVDVTGHEVAHFLVINMETFV